MKKKIAINGFGRIGRLVFRRILETQTNVRLVAINDLTSVDVLAHLLRFDSSFGPFDGTIEVEGNSLIVNGNTITVYSEQDAEKLPWAEHMIDIVIESTGFYASKGKAMAHIVAGAKKVLISAPAGEMKTIVHEVNHDILSAKDLIISVASCTTNALAPMAKILNDAYEIQAGTMTTIHAFTGNQALVDGPKGSNLRAARAAANNIVPYTTGAAKAIGLVVPELSGKLKGHAYRVPILDGSVVELVSILNKEVTVEGVNQLFKEKTKDNESFAYNDYEIVSQDIVGRPYGGIFDATQTEVTRFGDHHLLKTVAWYDNEFGFVSQLVRTLELFASL